LFSDQIFGQQNPNRNSQGLQLDFVPVEEMNFHAELAPHVLSTSSFSAEIGAEKSV